MANGICESCPLEASLRAAEMLIHNAYGHASPDQALGGIALLRNSLEGVANNIACSQHVNNPEGQLVCPLADAANTTRLYAYAKPMSAQFAVPLHIAAIEHPTETTTGQYL